MGCDIHVYLELAEKPKPDRVPLVRYLASMNTWRDYQLFGVLAGVREGAAVIKPRGVPEDMNWFAASKYYLFVSDDPDTAAMTRYVTSKQADDWIAQGLSYETSLELPNETIRRITDPDIHTASHLSLSELERCAVEYTKRTNRTSHDLNAIIGCLKAYEEIGMPRMCFWFDN